jgi:hypothetical protein
MTPASRPTCPAWRPGVKQAGVNIWRRRSSRYSRSIRTTRSSRLGDARDAKAAGLDIITWTLERSGILADGNNGFYFQTYDAAISREGDLMRVIDALAKDVDSRRILRLAGGRDLLRQLHGAQVNRQRECFKGKGKGKRKSLSRADFVFRRPRSSARPHNPCVDQPFPA